MITIEKIIQKVALDVPSYVLSYDDFRDSLVWKMSQEEGKIYGIYGRPGSGKTSFSLLLAQDILHFNNTHIFLTNMTVEHPRFKFAATASQLLEYLARYERPFLILDDSSAFYNSTEAMSSHVRSMNDLLVVIRKFRANLILIAHTYQYLPRIVKEWGEWIAKKRNKTKAEMDYFVVQDIPATTLQYNTYEVGYFDFDIDMKEVLAVLSGKAGEKMKEALKKYLEELKKNKEDKKLKEDYRYWLAKSAIMLKSSMGLPYSQYANMLGLKRETLRNWIKKFYNDME